MKKFISFFAHNHVLVNLITIFLIAISIYSTSNTPIETFPNIDLDIIIVTTKYPGSSPIVVEKLITKPIEDRLRGISGIEKIDSFSVESFSNIVIYLDTKTSNKNRVIQEINRIAQEKDGLPTEIDPPTIHEYDAKEFPIIEYALYGEDDFESLRQHARVLAENILNLDGISSVIKKGHKDKNIIVEVNPKKLKSAYIAIPQIIRVLKHSNVNFPGGKLVDEKSETIIHTINNFNNVDDVKRTVIRSNMDGKNITLEDIASIYYGQPETPIEYQAQGKKAIILTCIKKSGYDTIATVAAVEKIIKRYKEHISKGKLVIKEFNDLSRSTKNRVDVLYNNSIFGFVAVFLCLLIFLNPISAFLTAIGIPFTILISISLFNYLGITINLISMLGFILVLGILVDDALVISENITYYLERGKDRLESAVKGTMEVVNPIIGSILTTIIAFVPIFFIDGIYGKLIWAIPCIVTITLLISLLESLCLLPGHIILFSKFAKIKPNRFIIPLENAYRKIVTFHLDNKKISFVAIGIFCLISLLPLCFNLKVILFPESNISMFAIKYKLKAGTSLEQNINKSKAIDQLLLAHIDDGIDFFTSKAGTDSFHRSEPVKLNMSEIGVTLVYLSPDRPYSKKRKLKDKIATELKKLKGFEKITIEGRRTGLPVGNPIEVTIRGRDLGALQEISNRFINFLKRIKGVNNISSSLIEGKDVLQIKIDGEHAAMFSIDPLSISTTVRSAFEGVVATTIKRSDENVDIRIMLPKETRGNIEELKKIHFINQQGKLIPLNSIASFNKNKEPRIIKRINNLRAVIISANVDKNIITSYQANKMLKKEFKNIDFEYHGHFVSYEGEYKDTRKSLKSISYALVVSIILLFFSISSITNSLKTGLLILCAVPFGFLGILWAFFLHGLPLSFFGMIGAVGASGVVINDSIVLNSIYFQNMKKGLSLYDSVREGSVRRMRAVILTTVTTLFGLVPTIYGLGGSEKLLQPMVLAMAAGLLFASFFTIWCYPILFYALHSKNQNKP